ncbi:primosomal protein N' [Leifsonia sp. A12D58]|uniref:primosomal protein N' family DNA-binding protein n=1 Tax=Leifsonia sp. A12D58 TaxID=3397674 RepID=UPI0039E03237
MTHTGLVARVLIDSPLPQLDHLFDYSIPAELADIALPGVRVKVPFRAGRIAAGYLIEVTDAGAGGPGGEPAFTGTLSPLDSVVSAVQVLTPEVARLARQVADRAAGNASDVIRLAVPPRQVRAEKAWLAARAALAAEADGSDAGDAAAPESPAGLSAAGFDGYRAGVFDELIAERKRVAVAAVPRLLQLANGTTIGHWAHTLAELAAVTLQAGRSTLLVLPDYRDQDQVEAALAQLVPGSSVSRVDARQTGTERYRAFLACLTDEPRIVVGNRSAVYAPAPNLGLIALWDDGDPLHAELHSPYVHARDAALIRQQESGAALAFFSHSRSVETQRLVELGWLGEIHPERVVHPKVIPTAYQASPDEQARVARIPTAAWRAAKEALATGPVLVQVASPGYAPVLACQTCKQAARCTNCQGPLGLTTAGATPSCRLCGALAVSWQCSHCEGRTYRLVTIGTARTAEELGRAFPGVRVIIADGEHTIQHIDAQPALVIATRGAEPIPTGGYHAILLLDGERMLARESLRVGEDCLRWWSNAAAMAAPGASVVLVGVGGALARALNSWQPEAYAASELADRRVLRFPPAVRIASVTGTDDGVATAVAEFADQAGVDVLGPVPADSGKVRAVVRFAYADGDAVAHTLKAAIVRNASQRRKRAAGSSAAFVPTPTLKVRFDDPELL